MRSIATLLLLASIAPRPALAKAIPLDEVAVAYHKARSKRTPTKMNTSVQLAGTKFRLTYNQFGLEEFTQHDGNTKRVYRTNLYNELKHDSTSITYPDGSHTFILPGKKTHWPAETTGADGQPHRETHTARRRPDGTFGVMQKRNQILLDGRWY